MLCRVYKAVRGDCDIVAVKIMKGQHDPRSADLFAREVTTQHINTALGEAALHICMAMLLC